MGNLILCAGYFDWIVLKRKVCDGGMYLYLGWDCVNNCPIGYY